MARERAEVIEEFQKTHDEYLATLDLYEAPDEAAENRKSSLERFDKVMKEAKDGEILTEDLEQQLGALKKGLKEVKRGEVFCSTNCLLELISARQVAILEAARHLKDHAAIMGITKLADEIVTNAIMDVGELARIQTSKPWERREQAHEIIDKALDQLKPIIEAVQGARVLSISIGPGEDVAKKIADAIEGKQLSDAVEEVRALEQERENDRKSKLASKPK